MFYYEVAVSGRIKSNQGVFTYHSKDRLLIGSVVSVTLKNKQHPGFIVKKVTKPSYRTIEIKLAHGYSITFQSLNTYLKLIDLYPNSGHYLAGIFLPPSVKANSKTNTLQTTKIRDLPKLNDDQSKAYNKIITSKNSVLLFGDTGTGKTRLYMWLIDHFLSLGKDAVLLAPEIGLASYLNDQLSSYFRGINLYHSDMSKKDRSEVWHGLQKSEGPSLTIGPRSVIGLPFKNLGLVIIDESHDSSYRPEAQPFVSAKTVASILTKQFPAVCLYGTATPPVQDLFIAEHQDIPIVRLTSQASGGSGKPEYSLISNRDTSERNNGILLKSTVRQLREVFKEGGQALILINRRGSSRYIHCSKCGWESRCEQCDHLLVYHNDIYKLRCHHCERAYQMITSCPECGEDYLRLSIVGSKGVETEARSLFPNVRIARIDTDSSKGNRFADLSKEIVNGEIQCLIGTQMLAKGLDLPNLKCLVIIHSRISGGFASEEKEFSLLYQAIGRGTRGHQDTKIIIQTTDINEKIIKYAKNRDYYAFYKSELVSRQIFDVPPFKHLMIIHYSKRSPQSAQKAGAELAIKIKANYRSITVMPPCPDINEKFGKEYRWHLLVKSNSRKQLVEISKFLGNDWLCELDPLDTP